MGKEKNTRTEQSRSIPELRFSGFDDEWEKKKIKDFAPLQRGFDLPVDRIVSGKYPVVFSNGILKFHNEYKVKAPGVVTGRSGTIGKVTYVESDFWAHNTSLWVTDFKKNHPKYIYYFFSRLNLERFATGSGVPTLNRNDVHNQFEYLPTKLEQIKIASFFTAIDQKISQLKQKHQLLEQYKKGVMQKIFSQQIRFKDDDGREFPKWEKKRLGEMAINISSGKSNERNSNGQFPLFGSTGIIGFNDKYDYSGENILIARVGANAGSLYMVSGKYSVTDNTLILSLSKNINVKFTFYLLISINLNKLIFGSGQPLITGGLLKNIRMELPPLPEQTKIANFLSAIDDKIQHTQKQIDQAEQWKKGLMQRMFV